jgi:hypothetical protein
MMGKGGDLDVIIIYERHNVFKTSLFARLVLEPTLTVSLTII